MSVFCCHNSRVGIHLYVVRGMSTLDVPRGTFGGNQEIPTAEGLTRRYINVVGHAVWVFCGGTKTPYLVGMTKYYKIHQDGDVLVVGFGEPAQNPDILRELETVREDVAGLVTGKPLVKINGPASLPVAMWLAHAIVHVCGAIAVFDPKLGKYVVCVSHNPDYKVGDLVE